MTHNLVVFYKTADIAAQGVRLWPSNAKLWPTYLTLGVAGLSTIFATMVLLAYCWSTKAANRWNTARFGLTVLTIGFGVVMWALAGGGLNSTSDFKGIGSQSLWSAACDATAQQLQMFDKTVDFRQFCLEQVPSSYILSFVWTELMVGMGTGMCRNWNRLGSIDDYHIHLRTGEISTETRDEENDEDASESSTIRRSIAFTASPSFISREQISSWPKPTYCNRFLIPGPSQLSRYCYYGRSFVVRSKNPV